MAGFCHQPPHSAAIIIACWSVRLKSVSSFPSSAHTDTGIEPMDAPGPQHHQPGDDHPGAQSHLEKLKRTLGLKDFQAADALVAADPSLLHQHFASDWPPLMYMVQSETPAVCEWLLKRDLDVNEEDTCGSTALHKACRRGDRRIINMLLEKGADITIAGTYGYNPVMEATTAHSTVALGLLLDHLLSRRGRRKSSGADGEKKEEKEKEEEENEEERGQRINTVLNARQYRGQTALAISASFPGLREEAALLLQAGASPFVPDNDRRLPVHKARLAHQPDFFGKRLKEAMREPQRAWRLDQARAVLDARQALQGVLVGGEDEGGGEKKQEAKEGRVLAIDEFLKVVPACFRNRLMRRVEEEEKREEEVGKGEGKEGGKGGGRTLSDYRRLGFLEALPFVEWTHEGHEEEEPLLGGAAAGAAVRAAARAATSAAAAITKRDENRIKKELATMAFVMEGGLKEELWVEVREYMCVHYDGAARAGLGEAGKWWK